MHLYHCGHGAGRGLMRKTNTRLLSACWKKEREYAQMRLHLRTGTRRHWTHSLCFSRCWRRHFCPEQHEWRRLDVRVTQMLLRSRAALLRTHASCVALRCGAPSLSLLLPLCSRRGSTVESVQRRQQQQHRSPSWNISPGLWTNSIVDRALPWPLLLYGHFSPEIAEAPLTFEDKTLPRNSSEGPSGYCSVFGGG